MKSLVMSRDYGTLGEIVFVKIKLNATGYQKMLHGKLLPFTTERGDEKTIFQQDNAPIHAPDITKVPRFRNRIIAMDYYATMYYHY